MRCLACDRNLSDFESTRKFPSGGFIDLCNHCFFSGVSDMITADERDDLKEDSPEEETNDDTPDE